MYSARVHSFSLNTAWDLCTHAAGIMFEGQEVSRFFFQIPLTNAMERSSNSGKLKPVNRTEHAHTRSSTTPSHEVTKQSDTCWPLKKTSQCLETQTRTLICPNKLEYSFALSQVLSIYNSQTQEMSWLQECCVWFWAPKYTRDISTPESVQLRATKITKPLQHFSCEE